MNHQPLRTAEKSTESTNGLRLPIRPTIGLTGAILGTILSVVTIPEDVNSPSSLFVPALLMALGLALGPAVACWSDARAILRVENVIALSPVFWLLLEPLQRGKCRAALPGSTKPLPSFLLRVSLSAGCGPHACAGDGKSPLRCAGC